MKRYIAKTFTWVFLGFAMSFLGIASFAIARELPVHPDDITEDEVVINSRSELRAFYTAPPVIPHIIESRDQKDCLRCHAEVTHLNDGRIAMPTPHPEFTNCQQCHVAQNQNIEPFVENGWTGLEEPQYGNRWSGISPPTIPHRLFLRENCLSCHNPEHPNSRMRVPHPHRSACLQCHVPNVEAEF